APQNGPHFAPSEVKAVIKKVQAGLLSRAGQLVERVAEEKEGGPAQQGSDLLAQLPGTLQRLLPLGPDLDMSVPAPEPLQLSLEYDHRGEELIIEAAACGIPTIGTRINGIVDVIIEESTGFLVNKGNIRELAQVMERLGSDRKLLSDMGQAAKSRAIEHFSSSTVSAAWLSFYSSVLKDKV
ncbi:MAG: glycosyltransferase, partial [Gammaproteobacteria bacterium]|nr:glycosyltransferase [Gammaproteobacteria bacterium]